MRIALLAAGNSIHTVRWVNALAERDWNVCLLSLHPLSPAISPLVNSVRLPIPAPTGYFLNRRFVNQHLRRFNPDLLHSHYASGYGTLGRFADCYRKVLSVWGSDVYQIPSTSPLHRRIMTANLLGADCVCSTSQTMSDVTRRLCPRVRRIVVTPFGVDIDQFQPSLDRVGDNIVLGTIKSLAATYGIDVLIRGFAKCRQAILETNPALAARLRLKIGGDGPDRTRLERLAHACHIADVTEFLGPIAHTRVPAQLREFDIFIAMSRSESFGVSVVEASACAIPVIVSDVGGLPEVVRHERTGLIVPSEDISALAESMMRLVQDADLRHSFGAAGRRYIAQHFNWHENVTCMENLYRELVERAAAA